jgi:hypothetical protein
MIGENSFYTNSILWGLFQQDCACAGCGGWHLNNAIMLLGWTIILSFLVFAFLIFILYMAIMLIVKTYQMVNNKKRSKKCFSG